MMCRRSERNVALMVVFTLMSSIAIAQSIYEIGDSTSTNSTVSYPCPYGNFSDDSRHQMLFRANELIAEGMSEGDITSFAMKVDFALGTTLTNFTVAIGTTTDTVLTQNMVLGLMNVWGPTDQTAQIGWNTHQFATPFYWDGVSNIIVQTCNDNFLNSQNPLMVLSASNFVSTSYALTNTGSVCGAGGPGAPVTVGFDRPLARFGLIPNTAPPIAAFSPQGITTCSPTVQFTDLSQFDPTSWLWYFGDGDTSSMQNPMHTYGGPGSYDVSLVVTNAFGTDSVAVTSAVTLQSGTAQPLAACVPNTTGSLAGIGILQIDLEDVSVTSQDGQAEGYADRGCILDTVLAGSSFNVNIVTGTAAAHNIRVWVDFNNDATFSASELELSNDGVNSLSGSITVPGNAVLNTPLRLRATADYFLSPVPTPCSDPQYGQAEDYGLVVLPNTQPPIADFSTDPTVSCDGIVQFTDLSQNVVTNWQWDFGDTNTSGLQDPMHTYSTSGTYIVTLIVSNASGSDTLTSTVTVDLDAALVTASCTPATTGYCCDYGIYNVTLENIMNNSGSGIEGYQDFSCQHNTDVTEGLTYPIFIQTGPQNAEDVLVWIDLNNDGDLTSDERVFTANNVMNASGNITIPSGAVLNTPLRMRVASDGVGNINTSCSSPAFGQVEDYGVTILENTSPPVASFSGTPTVSCDGVVQFIDASSNIVTNWTWYFGDGNTSNQQDPLYTYTSPGAYDVSLVVSNAFGTDSITIPLYINVLMAGQCDTTSVAPFPQLLTECFGTITDDGGPNGNYTPIGQGLVTIEPTNAQTVTLTFSQFAFQPNDDYLLIFDGPTAGSPLIGQFSGFGVGSLPNGGVITSTGPAISLQQDVAFGANFFDGFIASWECTPIGIEELAPGTFQLWPNPTAHELQMTWNATRATPGRLQIVNGLGEVLMEQDIRSHNGAWSIDVSTWTAGLYSMIVTTKKGVWTGPFIVK